MKRHGLEDTVLGAIWGAVWVYFVWMLVFFALGLFQWADERLSRPTYAECLRSDGNPSAEWCDYYTWR